MRKRDFQQEAVNTLFWAAIALIVFIFALAILGG